MASTRDLINKKTGHITYQALYRHEGRQKSAAFPTAKARNDWTAIANTLGVEEALDVLEQYESMGAGKQITRLADYAHADVDLRPSVGDYMRKRYHQEIDRDWGKLGKLPIEAVTQKMVQKWIRDLLADGLSPATVAKKHGLMASVFRNALYDDALDMKKDPTARTKLPEADDVEMVALDHDELPQLLQYFPSQWHDFIIVSVALASRFGETTALTGAAWLPKKGPHGMVRIFQSWKETGTAGQFKLGPPKTKAGVREIPVSEKIAEIFNRRCANLRDDELIFTNRRGGRIDNDTFHTYTWKPALRLANGKRWLNREGRPQEPPRRSQFHGIKPAKKPLGKDLKVHGLRHTGGTWLAEATGDLHLVKYFMGHQSIQTTVDRYGHILPRRQAMIAAGMGASLGAALGEYVAVEALPEIAS